MSAHIEVLVEQIKELEAKIAIGTENKQDVSQLVNELEKLRTKFTSTVSVLNEGKVLKG